MKAIIYNDKVFAIHKDDQDVLSLYPSGSTERYFPDGSGVALDQPASGVPEREMSRDEKREIAYNQRGATIEALTVALVEAYKENRSESLDALQVIRSGVKSDYP